MLLLKAASSILQNQRKSSPLIINSLSLQFRPRFDYVECSPEDLKFIRELKKKLVQTPQQGARMIIDSFPQMKISLLRQIPEAEINSKELRRQIVYEVIRKHLKGMYFEPFMSLRSTKILNLIRYDPEAFLEFIEKDPQNEYFYIICMANLMAEYKKSYFKELQQFQPSNQLLIYLAKMRQKQLPPYIKVHLCRITHMFKLEYTDYLQFAKQLNVDITTEEGFMAFEGIISLHNSHQLIDDTIMRVWLRKFIQKFNQLPFTWIYYATDKIFSLIRVNSCIDEIMIITDLMIEAVQSGQTQGDPHYRLRCLKFASILKYKLYLFQQDAMDHIDDYIWMIHNDQNKKLILNVFKHNYDGIPPRVVQACILNCENKMINFIQLQDGDKYSTKSKAVIFRELTFVYKMLRKISQQYLGILLKHFLQVGKKAIDFSDYGSAMLALKILQNGKMTDKAFQLFEYMDAHMPADYAGHWITLYEFLNRHNSDFTTKYSIFDLNFKEFFAKNFDSYSQMVFFYEISCLLIRQGGRSKGKTKLHQLYYNQIENYLIAFIIKGNYTGEYLLKFLECVALYSSNYPKIPKIVEDNFIALVYDGRTLHKPDLIKIAENYNKLPKISAHFSRVLQKMITNFDNRKHIMTAYVRHYHPNMKVRKAIDWFLLRQKGKAFDIKQDDQYN